MNRTHDFELPGGYVRPDVTPYLNLLWYKARVRTAVLLQPQTARVLHATIDGTPDEHCKVETVQNDTDLSTYIIRSTGEGEYLELGIKVLWHFNQIGYDFGLSFNDTARPPICLAGPPAAMVSRCTACNALRRPVVSSKWDGSRTVDTVVRLTPGPIVFEYARAGGMVWTTNAEIYCPGQP